MLYVVRKTAGKKAGRCYRQILKKCRVAIVRRRIEISDFKVGFSHTFFKFETHGFMHIMGCICSTRGSIATFWPSTLVTGTAHNQLHALPCARVEFHDSHFIYDDCGVCFCLCAERVNADNISELRHYKNYFFFDVMGERELIPNSLKVVFKEPVGKERNTYILFNGISREDGEQLKKKLQENGFEVPFSDGLLV